MVGNKKLHPHNPHLNKMENDINKKGGQIYLFLIFAPPACAGLEPMTP
jgi:hypothetical protein